MTDTVVGLLSSALIAVAFWAVRWAAGLYRGGRRG